MKVEFGAEKNAPAVTKAPTREMANIAHMKRKAARVPRRRGTIAMMINADVRRKALFGTERVEARFSRPWLFWTTPSAAVEGTTP